MRWWTAFATIAICEFAVARGWDIVHFSVVMAKMGSSGFRAETIQAWTSVPEVASTALEAELSDKIDISDSKATHNRRQTLSLILSIKPMSSAYWLSLSGVQFVTDQPMDQVVGSFELAMLTGPNEGHLMADRGMFGASIWDSLSPSLKRHVAIDLTAPEVSRSGKLRALLSHKPARVRNEIREALLATRACAGRS